MASNTQNNMNYQPGAQYMHALTLATEAAVTRYYHEDVVGRNNVRESR